MKILTLVPPRKTELGDFSVQRILPYRKQRMVGPWIFFDHMGPADFAPGKGIDVRPHPHINLATVTYLFEGEIFHRDSLGSEVAITPGAINLMVAGKGIVHSERERPEIRNRAHRTHGLQLWLALPEDQEEIEPAFFHHPESDIPSTSVNGCDIRVMMGSAYGCTSPVQTFSPTLYCELKMPPGAQLPLPACEELGIYLVSGRAVIDGHGIEAQHMLTAEDVDGDELIAKTNIHCAIVGGAPLGQRFIEWNFVSSRPERIQEAKARWEAQEFPNVPGDKQEFIPLP